MIHLVLGVGFLPSLLAVSFVLAGLGFFGGIALLLFDSRRRALYTVGIPFTLTQIVASFVINPAPLSAVGPFDKVVQLSLVGVPFVLYRAEK